MRSVVVIPTYNEADNLQPLVDAVIGLTDFDVLIIDDNSPDGTGEVAEEMAAKHNSKVRVMRRPHKMGLGSAYLAGFKYALANSYDFVYQMDADFSHAPRDLARLHEALVASSADAVLGSRYVSGGGTRNWPWTREMLSRAGSLYARTVLGIDVADPTGGFKGFRRTALKQLDLSRIRSTGYSFQIETTYRCLASGCKVIEVPIQFEERQRGKSKMSAEIVLEAMLVVWQLRLETVANRAGRLIDHVVSFFKGPRVAG